MQGEWVVACRRKDGPPTRERENGVSLEVQLTPWREVRNISHIPPPTVHLHPPQPTTSTTTSITSTIATSTTNITTNHHFTRPPPPPSQLHLHHPPSPPLRPHYILFLHLHHLLHLNRHFSFTITITASTSTSATPTHPSFSPWLCFSSGSSAPGGVPPALWLGDRGIMTISGSVRRLRLRHRHGQGQHATPTEGEYRRIVFSPHRCIDNIRCNGLMMNAFEENSKVTVPQMIKSDTSLYCDDVDIRFSKMMNSCKVLQIRYASVERLLERLTDLRFLSIDFLNTFLHSYRVFTAAAVVLDKLITIYKKPISAIPARSLELFFASSQSNKLLYGEPPKSPRASRKFSSPPPLSITKSSSSSPTAGASCRSTSPSSRGARHWSWPRSAVPPTATPALHSAMSPFSKTALDINKLYVTSQDHHRRLPPPTTRRTPRLRTRLCPSKVSGCLGARQPPGERTGVNRKSS
ncbi:hypothetical protein CRUP_005133 [Coryphaenoides rupestris]|nr:hypothetical protein CRUP_005133 [Coryphaenoides rupestris]